MNLTWLELFRMGVAIDTTCKLTWRVNWLDLTYELTWLVNWLDLWIDLTWLFNWLDLNCFAGEDHRRLWTHRDGQRCARCRGLHSRPQVGLDRPRCQRHDIWRVLQVRERFCLGFDDISTVVFVSATNIASSFSACSQSILTAHAMCKQDSGNEAAVGFSRLVMSYLH